MSLSELTFHRLRISILSESHFGYAATYFDKGQSVTLCYVARTVEARMREGPGRKTEVRIREGEDRELTPPFIEKLST